MTKTFEGEVALVTGGSKGIGAEIAIQLAAGGAAVAVNYASSKRGADEVVAKITAKGGKAIAVHGNLAEPDGAKSVVAETVKAFGPIDVLVNNAGVYEFAPLDSITPEHFHRHFDLNVLGLLLATQEAARHFNANGGSIINISSGVSTITLRARRSTPRPRPRSMRSHRSWRRSLRRARSASTPSIPA
jgi:3-oxoacyl-[acyl-carrier protein] reductase